MGELCVRRGCVVKRVAQTAVITAAIAALLWVVTGIEVGTGRMSVFFVVALAMFSAIDFVERRARDARMASGVAAGVAGAGVTISVWTATEIFGLETPTVAYVMMFAATFVAYWLPLRRLRRRALRRGEPPHR